MLKIACEKLMTQTSFLEQFLCHRNLFGLSSVLQNSKNLPTRKIQFPHFSRRTMKYRKTGPWMIPTALSLMVCSVFAQVSTNPSVIPTQSKDLVRNAPAPVVFQVQTLVKGLSHPWSLAWLPGGDMLVTEREGRLRRISPDFQLDRGSTCRHRGGRAGRFV